VPPFSTAGTRSQRRASGRWPGYADDRIEDRNLRPIGERCRQPNGVATVLSRVRRGGGRRCAGLGNAAVRFGKFERAIAVNALAPLDGTLRALLLETYRLVNDTNRLLEK
jgi:hypothetical protein